MNPTFVYKENEYLVRLYLKIKNNENPTIFLRNNYEPIIIPSYRCDVIASENGSDIIALEIFETKNGHSLNINKDKTKRHFVILNKDISQSREVYDIETTLKRL